ncbi:MAG TPA: 6-bladed beta-propeller [Candidatus Saccharimonadales bacterium]|nr:6-bladed beta-propeller [Candidatus Saccharimonadales bacterium]
MEEFWAAPIARISRLVLIPLMLPLLLSAGALAQARRMVTTAEGKTVDFVGEFRSDADLDASRTPCQHLRDFFDHTGKARDVAGERPAVCDLVVDVVDVIAGKADLLPQNAKRPIHVARIATDSLRRIVVTEPDTRSVHILDFVNRKYTRIDGVKDDRMLSPFGVAVDADDNLYVTDVKRGMIDVFSARGKFKKYIGNYKGEGVFQLPSSIAIDRASGRIYLSDTLRHLVFILDRNGKELFRIGKRGGGSGPSEFRFPADLALHGQELFVLDKQNKRIEVFSLEGRYKREFQPDGFDAGSAKGLAVDTQGLIYLLFDVGYVQAFAPHGEPLFRFSNYGVEPGELKDSQAIYIDSMDRIYVNDTGNLRVEIFQIMGSAHPGAATASR